MVDPDSRYEDGKFLVQITNDILGQLHVEQRVKHWSDINAHVFVTLFEGISGEALRDVIQPMRTKEDEIHNVQVVVDTLSLDILHVSLSHITGEDVVAGNKRAIGNLMEVMLGLLDFVLEGIGSDMSSRNSEWDTIHLVDDPDLVTGDLIDEILEKELSKKCIISGTSVQETPPSGTVTSDHGSRPYKRYDNTTGNSTAELIALGRNSQEDISGMSPNNTAELMALGDSRYSSRPNGNHGLSVTQPVTSASRTDPPPAYQSKHNSATAPLPSAHDAGRRQAWESYSASPPSRLQNPGLYGTAQTGHSTAHIPTISPSKTVTSHVDSSISSSVHLPERPAESELPPDSEFTHLGMRPRSAGVQHPVGSGVLGGVASVLGGLSIPSSSSLTHHLYHHFDKPVDRAGVNLPDFSSSLPLDNSGSRKTRDRTTRTDGVSTMPVHSVRPDDSRLNSSFPATERPAPLGSQTHSYDNLQNLMHDTVAMSRAAVRTSPLRKRVGAKDPTSPTHTVPHTRSSQAKTQPRVVSNKESGSKVIKPTATQKEVVKPKSKVRPASSPPKTKLASSASVSPKGICSPPRMGDRTDKSNKKVSFKVGCSSNSSAAKPNEGDGTVQARNSFKKNGTTTGCTSKLRQSNTIMKYSTYPGPVNYAAPRHAASRSLFSTVPLVSDRKPQTFAEYLDKYYGILDRRDRLVSTEDEGASAHTDSAFEFSDASPCRADEYSGDADVSEDVETDIMRQAAQLPKSVRNNHIEDASAHGRMSSIQQKLSTESKRNMRNAQALAKLYDMELEDFAEDIADHMKSTRVKSHDTDREYKKKVLRCPKINKIKPKKTSVLRLRVRTRSNSVQPRGKKLVAMRARKRSASASPAVGRRRMKSPVHVYDDLLPWLLEEFPFLHLSKQTLHDLWCKSSRQVEQLTKAQLEVRRKKSKAQVQIEEAQRRHGILKDIMKKELAHNERMKELKDRQNHQQTVRTQLKNRRAQSARARRYYDEFQVRARSKMLKKRTREELVFKHLFKDGLDIQRNRIRELRRYAQEHREQRSLREQNQLESIENFYRDQFALISEAINRERKEIEIKDQAQSKVVEQMKRELRQKMEREIRSFQEQLYRDEDEEYFRQLDADHMRENLQLCRYQASI